MNVQLVYASRHGGTAGIAERIAEVMRAHGVDVSLVDAASHPDPTGFDAFVIGSGVYMGSWLDDGYAYLERNGAALAQKPTWLFSSGPLPGSTKEVADVDPLTNALGPAEGPGSGGHRRIDAISAVIQPRAHRVFQGAYDPTDPPKTLPERVVRMMPGSWKVLPVGDFRDWDAIEAWAREIAVELTATVPVA